MKEKILNVVAVILLIALIVIFSIKDAKSQKEIEDYKQEIEACHQQLIAVCGMVDEVAKKENEDILGASLREEKSLQGVISFTSAEEIENYVRFNLYNVFPDGIITVLKRGVGGEMDQVFQKTWKDYSKFFKIGKK